MAVEGELTGLKVMVVDDSNTIRRSAEIFLKQGGHEVMLAEDGFDALAKVNDYQPNLIFCDILMPRLDGYQTCQKLKAQATTEPIPVVFLSAKAQASDIEKGKSFGVSEYLTKPFDPNDLLDVVERLVG